eukprot:GHVT01037139.1.p1 GENE.GHVT01037139.1~~GHVT01037139.1.p1  ORF type:complete len:419 (-),score=62.77 GHVT01037139.1:109-1365(-)
MPSPRPRRPLAKGAPPSQGVPWLPIVAAVFIVGAGDSVLLPQKNSPGLRGSGLAPSLAPPPAPPHAALKSPSSINLPTLFPLGPQSSAAGPPLPPPLPPRAASMSPFSPEAMQECLDVFAYNFPSSSTPTRAPALTLAKKLGRRLTPKFLKLPLYCTNLFFGLVALAVKGITSAAEKVSETESYSQNYNGQRISVIKGGPNTVFSYTTGSEAYGKFGVHEIDYYSTDSVSCADTPIHDFPCVRKLIITHKEKPITKHFYNANNQCALGKFGSSPVIRRFSCDFYETIKDAIRDSKKYISQLFDEYAYVPSSTPSSTVTFPESTLGHSTSPYNLATTHTFGSTSVATTSNYETTNVVGGMAVATSHYWTAGFLSAGITLAVAVILLGVVMFHWHRREQRRQTLELEVDQPLNPKKTSSV